MLEELERFRRMTARLEANERNDDRLFGAGAFDASTILGITLIIIVAMAICGFTQLMMSTFKSFPFE